MFSRALTNKTIRVHGETVTSGITTTQSRDVRDAFAKGIYGRLFLHIVKVIETFIVLCYGKYYLESEYCYIQNRNKWE